MEHMDMSEKVKGVPLADVIAGLPPERRAQVEARTKELIAEELSLRALRKAMGKTQQAMALTLGIGQANVSQLEQRSDMLISTLNDYLKPLGGKLRLVAEFKDRPPVVLSRLGEIEATPPRGRRAKRAKAAA